MTLKRVARQISRSVREATKLAPSERRDAYVREAPWRVRRPAAALRRRSTPHLSKNNSIQRASDGEHYAGVCIAAWRVSIRSMIRPMKSSIVCDPNLEDIRAETQSPIAVEDDLDFEDVKSALREALPTHDAASLLAAANAVDRLVRSRSRSRSVSRGRASAYHLQAICDV